MRHQQYKKRSGQYKMPFKKSIGLGLLPVLCLILSAIPVHAQSFDWVKGMGGSYADYCRGVAVDGSGNVYVTGYLQSDTADFNRGGNGGTLINLGIGTKKGDVFLAKYDAAGTFLWAKNRGSDSYDMGMAIAVSRSGNVYIAGYFAGTPDFNPGGSGGTLNNAVGYDAFLAKYDKDGNYLWAKRMGGAGYDYADGVAVDSSDNVYVAGYMGVLVSDSADFNPGGSGGILKIAGGSDAFLAKYDKDGNYLWAKSMGGSGDENGIGVTVDGSNNVYVTGYFKSDTAYFNSGGTGGTLINAGKTNVFLAKYDGSGKYLWAKSMGGSSNDYGSGVAVDGSNNVYVTGYFKSSKADFNPGGSGDTLTNSGKTNVFLAKYDAGGSYLWAKNMGGSSNDYGYSVAVDGADNVYITGYFTSNPADFNPGGSGDTLTPVRVQDVFSAKYDKDGNYLWAKSMGGRNSDIGYGIAVDGSGNMYTTGMYSAYSSTDNTADFNPGGSGGVLTCAGVTNAFLVKFACNDTSSSHLTASLSCGEGYTLNDSIYTVTGVYTQVFPNAAGCDSTVILDLTIIPIAKPSININGFILGVSGGRYATYQWIRGGASIPGATDSTYAVTANGNYQVAVTNGKGCSDTSDVYPITNYTGITDAHLLAESIKIYPNPTVDIVYIQSPVKINVTLTDMEGRVIRKVKNAHNVSVKNLDAGIYLLRITDENGILLKMEKIIKAA